MTITIHVGSFMLGFFVGYAVIAAIFLWLAFSERWSNGFSEGWKAGKEYAEKKMEEGEADATD